MVKNAEKEAPMEDFAYMQAKTDWHARYWSVIDAKRNARIIALLSMLVAVLSLGLNYFQAIHGGIVYVPFLVDELGHTLSVQLKAMSDADKTNAITATMGDLVRNIRTVTSDGVQQKYNIETAYKFIAQGSNANTVIEDFYKTNVPGEIAKTGTVDVIVRSVGVQSDSKTYQVDWTEDSRDLQGGITKSEQWRGWFVVNKAPNAIADPKVRMANPFGLFVTAISWTRVQQ